MRVLVTVGPVGMSLLMDLVTSLPMIVRIGRSVGDANGSAYAALTSPMKAISAPTKLVLIVAPDMRFPYRKVTQDIQAHKIERSVTQL